MNNSWLFFGPENFLRKKLVQFCINWSDYEENVFGVWYGKM